MTATDELRRMLDERGVEYEGGERSLRWRDRNGVMMQAFPLANGELGMGVWSCTPGQAIAATLGRSNVGRYVGLRQGKCWERTEYSNYYCGGCGWKVTDHDSYCPECGGALHKATLGRGTCRIIEAEPDNEGYRRLTIEPYQDATSNDEWFGIMGVCSECGEYVPKMGYCPNCGRKVVTDG